MYEVINNIIEQCKSIQSVAGLAYSITSAMNKKKRLSAGDKEYIDALLKNAFDVKAIVTMLGVKYERNTIMNYIRMKCGNVQRRGGEWYEKIEF